MRKKIVIALVMCVLAVIPVFGATSIKDAGAELYASMKNRKEYFTITIYNNGETVAKDPYTILKEIDGKAFQDSGTGRQGDFVKYIYDAKGYRWEADSREDVRRYQVFYNVKYKETIKQKKAEDKEVKRLKKKFAKGSGYKRVKRIHNYLAKNVKFGGKGKKKFTPYGALINKQAVCQGYALAFYRLCRESSVPCRCITGTAEGHPHMWNIVKLGNKWYNVDVTWDRGGKTKYFLKGSNWEKHTLAEEYRTKEFRKRFPMAEEAY